MAEDHKYPAVTPADVLKYARPTEGFLCPISANVYGISFGKFVIRNVVTNETLLNIEPEEGVVPEPIESDDMRTIRYAFSREFLKLEKVGTAVEFKVGEEEVKNFRMIERHYYGGKLLRSYDFTFGFCIPHSKNSWEVIYSLPQLKDSEINEMVKHPFETKSDSFYFVGNTLIMHHKAEYEYT
ncbi:MAG: PDE6D/unc-119 family protein [Candidatus Pacebacteria bacterium]|nr:PDE6D/unc-119 family protein [Candidatus Paceibacterota bacterium]